MQLGGLANQAGQQPGSNPGSTYRSPLLHAVTVGGFTPGTTVYYKVTLSNAPSYETSTRNTADLANADGNCVIQCPLLFCNRKTKLPVLDWKGRGTGVEGR